MSQGWTCTCEPNQMKCVIHQLASELLHAVRLAKVALQDAHDYGLPIQKIEPAYNVIHKVLAMIDKHED